MRVAGLFSVRSLAGVLLLLTLLFTAACQPEAPKQPEPLKGDGRLYVHALDVGQGDGLLVVSPGGKSILIDAGPSEAGDEVVAALQRRGSKSLDLMVATHPHADHIGGMRRVLESFRVRKLLDSGQQYTSATYERLLQTIRDQNISLVKAQQRQTIEVEPGIKFEILNPGREFITNVRSGGSLINANSVVLRLSYGNFAMLFTGDAEFETEAALMNAGLNLNAQVLKIGHHGSRHATSGKFLDTVKPQEAIISDGATNDYGHPAQPTLDRLRRAQVKIWRTDLQGEITIVSDGQTYEISSQRKATLTQLWLGRQPILNELAVNP